MKWILHDMRQKLKTVVMPDDDGVLLPGLASRGAAGRVYFHLVNKDVELPFAFLAAVHRAAKDCGLFPGMIDSGELFYPLPGPPGKPLSF